MRHMMMGGMMHHGMMGFMLFGMMRRMVMKLVLIGLVVAVIVLWGEAAEIELGGPCRSPRNPVVNWGVPSALGRVNRRTRRRACRGRGCRP